MDLKTVDVPIVDLAPWLANNGDATRRAASAAALRDAYESLGFVQVTGHGIDNNLASKCFNCARNFFNLDLNEKLRIATPKATAPIPESYREMSSVHNPWLHRRGFVAAGSAPFASTRDMFEMSNAGGRGADWQPQSKRRKLSSGDDLKGEQAKENTPPQHNDQDEAGDDPYGVANVWPADAGFRESFEASYKKIERVMMALAAASEAALEVPSGTLTSLLDGHVSTMGISSMVPPAAGDPSISSKEASQACASDLMIQAHTDPSFMTILMYEAQQPSGLELQPRFLPADPTAGWVIAGGLGDSRLLVNIGTHLQRLTNDRWLATKHRVRIPNRSASSGRQTMAYFARCRPSASLGPLPAFLQGAESKYGEVDEKAVQRLMHEATGAVYTPMRPDEDPVKRREWLQTNRAKLVNTPF